MGQQIEFALSESMHRVLVKLVSFLPGFLALVAATLAMTALGGLLSFVLRRVLTALRFDERFARTSGPGVADWSPANSPMLLVARTAFWICVLFGVVIGISAFDASYAGNSQLEAILIPYLTHSVGAILILLAGTIVARFLARSVLIGAVNLQLQYARLLSLGVKWLVLVMTGAMVLDHLEIGGAIVALSFGILLGGIVLTLSLAIGLGSRELVSRALLEKNIEPRVPTSAAQHGDDVFDPLIAEAGAGARNKAPAGLRHF